MFNQRNQYPGVVFSPVRHVSSEMDYKPRAVPLTPTSSDFFYPAGPGYRTPPPSFYFDPRIALSPPTPLFLRSPQTVGFPDPCSPVRGTHFTYASPTPRYAFTPPRRNPKVGALPHGEDDADVVSPREPRPMRGAGSFQTDPLVDPFRNLSLEPQRMSEYPKRKFNDKPKFSTFSDSTKSSSGDSLNAFAETHLVVAALDRKQSLQLQKHIAKVTF